MTPLDKLGVTGNIPQFSLCKAKAKLPPSKGEKTLPALRITLRQAQGGTPLQGRSLILDGVYLNAIGAGMTRWVLEMYLFSYFLLFGFAAAFLAGLALAVVLLLALAGTATTSV